MENDLIQFYKDKKDGMPKSAALKLYGDKLGKDFIEEEYGGKQKAEFEFELRQPYVEKLLIEQTELLKSLNERIENLKIPEYLKFPKTIKIEKPDWWKEPQVIVKPPEVEVKVPEIKIPEIKVPITEVDLKALGELPKAIKEAILRTDREPLPVVLIDPERMTKYRAEMTAIARAPENIRAKGNTSKNGTGTDYYLLLDEDGHLQVDVLSGGGVGDGTLTISTAGTRVQLPNISCKKVFIQAHESNTGTIVVGGSTCVAALEGRRGIALYPSQGQWFEVNNLNLLYVDATDNNDKITYIYEN